ncbi:CoA transferase [Siccirubricoccus deserti]
MSVAPGQVPADAPGILSGIRVIEEADETAEYCGLILAGLGAEVVKLEPPEGAATRRIGPFLDDRPGPERSLHFWAYNRGKRSVIGSVESTDLLANADILLTSRRDLDLAALRAKHPRLIVARMTPFGDTGPWKDFKGSDLVHLALGGIMMMRLRPRSGAALRSAADRAAALARLPHRGRAAHGRHPRRAAAPAAHE